MAVVSKTAYMAGMSGTLSGVNLTIVMPGVTALDVSALFGTIGLLNELVATVQGIKVAMTTLDDAVSAVGAAVAADDKSVHALIAEISTASTVQQAKIDALSAQVATLQSTVASSGDVAGAVKALGSDVAAIQAQGAALDAATTALAAAVAPPPATPAPTPTPAPAPDPAPTPVADPTPTTPPAP